MKKLLLAGIIFVFNSCDYEGTEQLLSIVEKESQCKVEIHWRQLKPFSHITPLFIASYTHKKFNKTSFYA